MKKRISRSLTKEQREQLAALSTLPDDRIDTSDIAEIVNWPDAERGLFYQPVKQQITLRLDADVVAWFKRHAPDGRAIRPRSIGRCGSTFSSGRTRKVSFDACTRRR